MRTLIFFLCLLPAIAAAQTSDTERLPKLRITQQFLGTQYELGDDVVKPAAVRLHLEQHSAPAYHHWRRADGQDLGGAIWGALGAAGMLTGLLAKKTNTKAAGYGLGAVGIGVSAVLHLSSSANRARAVKEYNSRAGF